MASGGRAGVRLPTHLNATLRPHRGAVHVARFDAQGRYLLTAGADRKLHLFNAARADDDDALPIKSYAGQHSGVLLGLSIASDNATFVAGGEERNVLQWDVATATVLRRFHAHAGPINVVLYCGAQQSPNDVIGAAGADGTVRLYDVRARGAWRPMMTCGEARDAVQCAAWRDSVIWTGAVDGCVRAYDVRKGELRCDTIDRPITSVVPTATAKALLVTTLGRGDSDDEDAARATHILLNNADGTHLQTIRGGRNVHYRCSSALFAGGDDDDDDEQAIIAGDEQGQLAAWSSTTGTPLSPSSWKTSAPHDKAVLWTECSRQRTVTASADGTVKLWSVPT